MINLLYSFRYYNTENSPSKYSIVIALTSCIILNLYYHNKLSKFSLKVGKNVLTKLLSFNFNKLWGLNALASFFKTYFNEFDKNIEPDQSPHWKHGA